MEKFLTVKELSRATGFPLTTLLKYQRIGKIPVIRLGYRTLRFRLSAVMESLQAYEIRPRPVRGRSR